MITLEQIILEGYGSIVKRTTFNLHLTGLNILRGKVGSGKTTIPSSLSWVIFGTTLKKGSSVETWEEIRPEDFKGTFGRLDFRKEKELYSIIRCINYKGNVIPKTKGGSKLILLKDGQPILTERNKKDVQAKINEILGYSFDLFTNSIIFGQRLKRLIEESGPNKKKIFDEAFEVLFIDKAKKETEVKRNNTRETLGQVDTNFDHLLDELESAKEFYEDAIEFENNFNESKKLNINKIETDIKKLSEKELELAKKISKVKVHNYDKLTLKVKDKEKEIKKLNKALDRAEDLSTLIGTNGDHIAHEISKVTKLTSKLCYTCGQVLDKKLIDSLKAELEKKIKKSKAEIVDFKKEIKAINVHDVREKVKEKEEELTKLKESLYSNSHKYNLKKQMEGEIANLRDRLKDYSKELKAEKKTKLKVKSDKYSVKIEKLTKKLKKVKKEKKTLQKQEEIQTWLIKDPLSNNGLKAYIFNSLLGKVNQRLMEYNDLVGIRIEFGIDLESGNKDFYQMIYADGITINYPDLSGGQKQLVDTTVALAIHDVISSVRPINVLFMDEPFEGLDEETIEIVSEIITHKAKEQNVFMITHHNSFNPPNANTIYFERGKDKVTVIS